MAEGPNAPQKDAQARNVHAASGRRGKTFLVFLLILVVHLLIAGWLFWRLEYVSHEAGVRCGIARDVLSRNRRGKEGLVCSVRWAPLPTFLYLPMGIVPGLIEGGFAGSVLSALGGTLFLFYLCKLLGVFQIGRWPKYVLLAGAGLNPWVFFSSVNGTSLMLLLGLVAGALYHFTIWRQKGNLHSLIMLSLYGAALPLIRYQASIWSAIIIGGVFFVSLRRRKEPKEVEGTFLLAVCPVIYGVGLWFLFNWLIMGNFLYFLRVPKTATSAMRLWGGLLNSLRQMAAVAPLFPVAVGLLILQVGRRASPLRPILTLLIVSIVAVSAWSTSRGNRFNFLESSLLLVPLCIIVVAAYLAGLGIKKGAPMRLARTGLCGLVVLSVVLILSFAYLVFATTVDDGNALPETGAELADEVQQSAVAARRSSHSATEGGMPRLRGVPRSVMELAVRSRYSLFDPADPVFRSGGLFFSGPAKSGEEEGIGRYIEQLKEDCRVVIVGFRGYDFCRRARARDRFIHLVNLDMPLIMKRTRGKTLYLLVPCPEGNSAFDDINIRFPRLYWFGEANVSTKNLLAKIEVDRNFRTWRLFRVIRGDRG